MISRPACLVLFACCIPLLTACGSKGPLSLPDGTPVKQARPTTVSPTPAQPPAQTTADHNSTTTPPASQGT